MSVEIKGKVVKKTELIEGEKDGRAWEKQGIVLATDNEYNPNVYVECFGKDKVRSLNQLEEGMYATILCNVYSREFKGRYYTTLDGYLFTNQSNNATNPEFVTSDNEDNPF
jgi:hypothetical protein|tara:strand:+ start:1464 stop:1796 length:333 start_codon:yes stop_codon:yes gene_type:complete